MLEWRSWSRVTRAIVLGSLLLAAALRIADALYEGSAGQGVDPLDYQHYAHSIGAGLGYPSSPFAAGHGPSSALPPLYPYLLGGLDALTGDDLTVARLVGAALSFALVPMLAIVARRLLGPAAGLGALMLAAVYPPLVIAGSTTLSEVLFLPLEVAALLQLVALRDAPAARGRWVALGVTIGLATLARPVGAVLLLPAALVLRPQWRALAAVCALTAATVSPWVIRDAIDFHRLVPITIEDGYQLAGLMSDQARGNPEDPGSFYPPNRVARYAPVFADRRLGEDATNDRLRSLALDYLGEHPAYALKVVAYNVLRELHFGSSGYEHYEASDLGVHYGSYVASRLAFWLVALLALAGAFTAAVRRAPRWPWIVAGLLFATAVINASATRYRYPADPFLLLLAGAALAALRGAVARDAPGGPSGLRLRRSPRSPG